MKKTIFHRIPFFGLVLAIIIASTGFMTLIKSHCMMMEGPGDDSGMMMTCCGEPEPFANESHCTPVNGSHNNSGGMTECCENPVPIPGDGPVLTSLSRCHTITLAGLPSTLLSTPAQQPYNSKIIFSLQNFILSANHPPIRNHKSEIINPLFSLSPPYSVERNIFTSTFRI
jgi:hypothetical protein